MLTMFSGAGPAGLASAKAMQEAGLSPRVFEATGTVGGLWSPQSKLCRPSMRTNLSKHTCCFSEFMWPLDTPIFPSAAQVGEYLSSFAERYLDPKIFSFNCKVTGMEYRSNGKWIITWSVNGKEENAEFDYAVLACGFFSEPYIPPIPGLDSFPGSVIHSSSYLSPDVFKDQHVAIIGGSLSSVEVAEDIAPFAASINHVIPRPFWIIPKYLPLNPQNPGTSFFPLDLVLYRRQRHEQEPDPTPEARWSRTNAYLRSLCGDLSEISEHLKVDMDLPPYAAVSDMYTNFVRSGRIVLHTGHLTSISGSTLTTTPVAEPSIPDNITHIIFATGFRPSTSSNILSPSLLSALSFSETDHFLPFLLHRATLHPSLPNAAFVGHYRGPYWAIIELQARWCAGLFSGSLPWPSTEEMHEGIAVEENLRNSKPRMQWPRGDYVNFGCSLAKTIGVPLEPEDPSVDEYSLSPRKIFGPAQFSRPMWLRQNNAPGETNPLLRSLEQTLWQLSMSGLYVAAAVFRSLHGLWKLNRTYVSRRPEYPSGPSTGTAEFIPRKASAIPESSTISIPEPKIEYLYSEKTVLTSSSGLELQGSQQYIYRYDEPNDKLEVYFAKRDEAFTLDYLFHQVNLNIPEYPYTDLETLRNSPWTAKSSHFCSPDNYEVGYTFFFKGADLDKWKIEYEVKGPKKDYSMATWYQR
jgi:cation diffusion facilitator CzcD-associated flavoprotein CzcO